MTSKGYTCAQLIPTDTNGRFCAPSPLGGSCCLPCPATEWVYPDSFNTATHASEWLNVLGLVLLAFMLLTYLVLPTQQTRSHYLSICLIISVMFIALGFTVPLGAKPDQCYNEITPNDMYTSTECAWSGAFIIAGGLCAAMWIFIRALSMNLQICWDIVPGKKFFYISQAAGWGIPGAFFTAVMAVTGVSFRFGAACHVNHENAMADFWGPLLGMAGGAGVLQLMTFAYCIKVYLKNLFAEQSGPSQSSASGSGLPSYSGSVKTQTARAVWRRLKKVLWLQWRGICIVTIILVDVIFFSIVFVNLDRTQSTAPSKFEQIKPWLGCLLENQGNKDLCLQYVGDWMVNESTVIAVLLLLGLSGLQVFLFLTRPSVFPAWIEWLRNKFSSRQEFVSLDARPEAMRSQSKQEYVSYTRGHESTTFEMQSPTSPLERQRSNIMKRMSYDIESKSMSPTETTLSSPQETYKSPYIDSRRSMSPNMTQPPGYSKVISPGSPPTPVVRYDGISLHRQPSDYFSDGARPTTAPNQARPRTSRGEPPRSGSAQSERRYQPPNSSFSTPMSPSRQGSIRSVTLETRDVYARGGLALNPPSEAGESQEDLTQSARYWHGQHR